MISAKVIADSISPCGDRLTTMELEYPRFIHGELMTHRVFSRNAASSRAIPTAKLIEQVQTNPAMPIEWGSNQPGMQAGPPLTDTWVDCAEATWRQAAREAAARAEALAKFNVHKQVVNRILEPFMWMKTIISSTEWENFFIQRISHESQPEMRRLAFFMEIALENSAPEYVGPECWHMPYMDDTTYDIMNVAGYNFFDALGVSVARCARVSYMNHGAGKTIDEDLALYKRLKASGHWSPFEHVATPSRAHSSGNFTGWYQLRHLPADQ